jgi:hypothetical protein
MNIHDFPEEFKEEDVSRIHELIFAKQHLLAKQYVEIESKNGLRWDTAMPLNLNSAKAQAQLKDFAWRVTEELGESLEAWFESEAESNRDLSEHLIHSKEELADGLHFLVEYGILINFPLSKLKEIDLLQLKNKNFQALFDEKVVDFILTWGITQNCLKNKPWKQTQYETDKTKLSELYYRSYINYFRIMLHSMTPLEILNYYFRKSKVNDFRIKSKY